MVVRRLRIWLRVVLAMIAVVALLLTSSVASAQAPRPSPLAGDVLTSGRPGEKATPPPLNPGSIVLGTAGVLGDLMFGDSPMRDAALYGIGGASAGGVA